MVIAWDELRAWVQLALATLGGALALIVFFQNLKQRRVENALKFLAEFRSSLSEGDLESWETLFWQASEPAGAPPGHYASSAGVYSPISDYFSEGSPDGHAISRMAESLDVLCHQVLRGSADALTVHYAAGQLLRTFYWWLNETPSVVPNQSLLDQAFPNIAKFHAKFDRRFKGYPSRVFAYIE